MAIQIFPELEAGGGGINFELIATATPTGTNTITFSSIDSKYKYLKLILADLTVASNSFGLDLRLNNISTGVYSYAGRYQALALTGAGLGAFGSRAQSSFNIHPSEQATTVFTQSLYFFDNNISGSPTVMVGQAYNDRVTLFDNCIFNNTAVINRIDIIASPNYTAGSVYLLGSE